MLPAHQRFEARHLAFAQIDDRLVVQHQLAALDRLLQLGAQRIGCRGRVDRPRRIDGVHAAAHGFGAVERHVGAGEKLLGRLAVMRRQGDADAGFSVQAMAEHVVRAADVLQDAAGEVVGEILAIDADLQDGELIAAEAADHVAGAQAALQPAATLFNRPSPTRWPCRSLISLKWSRSSHKSAKPWRGS